MFIEICPEFHCSQNVRRAIQALVDDIEPGLRRCFGLLDRQRFSKTSGSFDKDHWHFRTKDFSSSAVQMSGITIVRLAELQQKGVIKTPFEITELQELVLSIYKYTWNLQHSDGSFDEWYPNERGWGGPTGYVLFALCQMHEYLREQVKGFNEEDYRPRFLKSAHFLGGRPELGTLANHHAVTMLALFKTWKLTGDDKVKRDFDQLRFKFLELCEEEGWSLEYDGFDAGYNLATISFLSRILQEHKDAELETYCLKSLEFVAQFIYPDGTFGGKLSSRQTTHHYPYPWLFWSSRSHLALQISQRMIQREILQCAPKPYDQDDHYLHYRLWEYLDAISCSVENDLPDSPDLQDALPWDQERYFKFYPRAGVFIYHDKPLLLYGSTKRGGAFELFHSDKRKRVSLLSDSVVQRPSGKIYCAQFNQEKSGTLQHDTGELLFEGNFDLMPLFNESFTPLRFLLFRIFTFPFSLHPFVAHIGKGLIRKSMILDKITSIGTLRRKILLKGKVFRLEDCLKLNKRVKRESPDVSLHSEIWSRYVPQSQYFERPILSRLLNSEEKTSLESDGELTLKQEVIF